MRRIENLLLALAAGIVLLGSCEIPPLVDTQEYVNPEARITIATAALPGTAGRYQTGASLAFNGSASVEGDGAILSYAWDFGDGSAEETGESLSHSYAASGTYTVTLTVTDALDQIDEAAMTLVINEAPQAAIAGGNVTVEFGEAVFLDGSGSSDGDGTLVSWQWDLGDGTSATGSSLTHTYSYDGTYAVTLTVTDDRGTTDSASVTVTVNPLPNVAPTADGGADQNLTYDAADTLINLDGSGSGDSDGTLASVLWSFTALPPGSVLTDGDIAGRNGLTPSFDIAGESDAAAANGSLTYELTLTVTDNDGATDTDTVVITITGTGSAVIGIE